MSKHAFADLLSVRKAKNKAALAEMMEGCARKICRRNSKFFFRAQRCNISTEPPPQIGKQKSRLNPQRGRYITWALRRLLPRLGRPILGPAWHTSKKEIYVWGDNVPNQVAQAGPPWSLPASAKGVRFALGFCPVLFWVFSWIFCLGTGRCNSLGSAVV